MSKAISHAVVITDLQQILLCKVTGKGFWDLPKGGADDGELSICAARRELKEETSIDINLCNLIPFGTYYYNRWKDLNVFIAAIDELPSIDNMICKSTFGPDNLPEVEDFKYIPIWQIAEYTNRNMYPLLVHVINELKEIKYGKDTDIEGIDVLSTRLLQSRWMR